MFGGGIEPGFVDSPGGTGIGALRDSKYSLAWARNLHKDLVIN